MIYTLVKCVNYAALCALRVAEQLVVTRITVTANESNAVAILILNEFDHMLKLDWKIILLCVYEEEKSWNGLSNGADRWVREDFLSVCFHKLQKMG